MPSDDDLLTAYVDGVAELNAHERKHVETLMQNDESMRTEATRTREVIAKLRELPPEGNEPDWTALERSIGDAVGPEAPRTAWWRRFGWRLVVPAMALVTAAAIIALLMNGPVREATTPTPTPIVKDEPQPAPIADDGTMALWLDGEKIEVDLDADELLESPWGGDLNEEDLLPASDLAWIDELDGESLDRAEAWLRNPQPKRRKRS